MIKNIINKIKEFLNNFFKKDKVLMIDETNDNSKIDINRADFNENSEVSDYLFDENSKKDFFTIYQNVKKGIINLDDLLLQDMIKVQLIMQEELTLLDKNTNTLKKELNNLYMQEKLLEQEKKV